MIWVWLYFRLCWEVFTPRTKPAVWLAEAKQIPGSRPLPALSIPSLSPLVIGNSTTGRLAVSLEDVEWMCSMDRACSFALQISSVVHVWPGHQGPPLTCTGHPCCPCHYYVPRGVCSLSLLCRCVVVVACSKDCYDCLLVRHCRTRVPGQDVFGCYHIFYFRGLGYYHSVVSYKPCVRQECLYF